MGEERGMGAIYKVKCGKNIILGGISIANIFKWKMESLRQ